MKIIWRINTLYAETTLPICLSEFSISYNTAILFISNVRQTSLFNKTSDLKMLALIWLLSTHFMYQFSFIQDQECYDIVEKEREKRKRRTENYDFQ